MAQIKVKRFHGYRFPWRNGNRVELLIDGHRFFPAMVSAIEAARKNVALEMYLFESGVVASHFIHALCSASRRGVSVRLLLDGFGALALLEEDRKILTAAGVDLRFYNPIRFGKFFRNMARDHRKLLVVDEEIAFVGGAGITDEFDPPLDAGKRWRETMAAIRGPVVQDWQYLFDQVWQRKRFRKILLPDKNERPDVQGHMLGRVAVGRGRLFRGIVRALIKRINQAQDQVWISTAYFIPSRLLRRALRRAAKRGVDVRLLLPGPETDHPRIRIAGRGLYSPLLKAGVQIFEFQSRVLHSKVMLCDQWTTIGSANFDRWNLRWNLEANQEIEDRHFCDQVVQMFENDYRDCVEITHQAWIQRPWQDRVEERFWGWVELWIIRLGGGWRA